MSRSFFTVEEFALLLKEGIDSLFPYPISVRGEVSNLKIYPSGHAYFSLKDDRSVVSCVLFSSAIERLRIAGKTLPKNGDDVIVTARVSVYASRGQVQLNCLSLEPYGRGEALLRLEELKKKLAAEGLFDETRKKALPRFPRRVGVIAGAASAGLKDILTNLRARWPLAEVMVFESLVQGQDAPKSLIRALERAKETRVDTLIIGRGGGSSEDLNAFNDEALVRAVADFPSPVISAVGHEIDTTLVDFVSDKRVSTPTGAAVAAVPDQKDILRLLEEDAERIGNAFGFLLSSFARRLASLASRPVLQKPENLYLEKERKAKELENRLETAAHRKWEAKSERVSAAKGKLNALNPRAVLNRGYTITLDENGIPLNSVSHLRVGTTIRTCFADGTLTSRIETKEQNNGK